MGRIYGIFLKGLVALLPVMLTLYLLIWVASQAEHAFGAPLRAAFPIFDSIPGAGFLVAVLLIFLVGLLVNSYITRRFVDWFEERMNNVPVIRSIYSPIRDVTNLFANNGTSHAQRVVMVKLPFLPGTTHSPLSGAEHGIELLGLITRDRFDDLPPGVVDDNQVAVFVPFSYGMGGMTVLVSKSQIRETPLAAERAMQLAITGWIKSSNKESR